MRRRQIVPRRDFRASGRLGRALFAHDPRAFQAQLDAREGVDRVVDAQMPRRPAAQHLAVGRVDDGIRPDRGDIAAPQPQPRVGRGTDDRGIVDISDAAIRDDIMQQRVLVLEPLAVRLNRFARVHIRAKQCPQVLRCHGGQGVVVCADTRYPAPGAGAFVGKIAHQRCQALRKLVHVMPFWGWGSRFSVSRVRGALVTSRDRQAHLS